VLLTGYLIGTIPGIVVATCAVSAGVISEAIYAGIVVRPVLRRQVRSMPPIDPPLTLRPFLDFYIPLVLTSLLTLMVQPIGSAALSRMPQALASLAVWPVVSGMIFMLRSLGIAYNEVVVALLDEPGSTGGLRRFTGLLGGGTTLIHLAITGTPLAGLWFGVVSGLSPDLAALAATGLWIALPLPVLNVLQSWFQGLILHDRRTSGITEAVIVFLASCTAMLWAGVLWGGATGLYVGLVAFVVATFLQTVWLWFRSRRAEHAVQSRDQTHLASSVSLEATTD
jgi:hypothetical protein